jgi:hypothetical protein
MWWAARLMLAVSLLGMEPRRLAGLLQPGESVRPQAVGPAMQEL